MAQRLPVDLVAEFRGMKPASTFPNKQTGEIVNVPAKLKFEQQREDGDVQLVDISAAPLERMTPPVDPASFKRGDYYRIQGEVILQDRGSDRDSYFSITSVAPASDVTPSRPARQTA